MKTMLLLLALTVSTLRAAPAIIPAPESMTMREGVFTLRPDTRILAGKKFKATGELLAGRLRASTGFPFPVKSNDKVTAGAIVLTTANCDASLGPEGYELTVRPDMVIVRAPTDAGLFYGAQTLLQLLPPEVFSKKTVSAKWEAPCLEIRDQPRFAWRGLLLDVSRHFYTTQEVEEILDALALHKINTLHWHLVDDEGWRIQIKKYPRLTQVGAWRKFIGYNLASTNSAAYGPDGRYGGFYTQKDIREVVRYAAARHITIVPEIEMPGHSIAALAAYPQFSCAGGPFSTDHKPGSSDGVYCAGNDESFVFLENILTEVMALFPGKYIHVGGDEVSTSNWAKCEKCQALKKTLHLQNDRQLESYFIQRIEQFINAHGRSLIGWSEIREGGLAKNAALMDWIGGATEGATSGHDVVMTPSAYCYLDHYQSRDHSTEPHAIGGFLPLSKVYSFEPIPAKLAPEFQHHILGAQGNLWTEYIPNLRHAEYMIFPRECALAEVTWSQKDEKNFDDFLRRLEIDERRLDEMGVNYRRNPLDTGR